MPDGLVCRRVEQRRDRREPCVQVARRGGVVAADGTRAKLADRLQKRHVVRADVILHHVDDGLLQRRLAVVVRRLLGGERRQLCTLSSRLLCVSFLAKHACSTRCAAEAVDGRQDRSSHVGKREVHESCCTKCSNVRPRAGSRSGHVQHHRRRPPPPSRSRRAEPPRIHSFRSAARALEKAMSISSPSASPCTSCTRWRGRSPVRLRLARRRRAEPLVVLERPAAGVGLGGAPGFSSEKMRPHRRRRRLA